jgi:hypothetical protein
MAFDQKTRNLLQRTVTACRRVLDREFTAQLQELYGIQPDGSLTPVAALEHLGDEELEVASLLRERINHLEGGAATQALTRATAKPEHVGRVIREQAFTVLNRLAALRLCEERGLVLECVRRGLASEGFKLFTSSAGNALGASHEAYRIYLDTLFDELGFDLGILFDRFSPLALIFPRPDALAEVLRELDGSGKAAEHEEVSPEEFAETWRADETIGWIYQYYNDEAERKKMRKESSAPRNSRELAVRNQFFTPRYVVEFLTDNTLGRIWYEMTRGETKLQEQCSYLVRRPTEIFLKPGEEAPGKPKQDNLSQEQLLKQTVHIPHRPLKDPRTILMLDPACGSMHFGLYAFDLFEVIYDEAWALEETSGTDVLSRPRQMKSLHDTYAGRHAFVKDVPRLIIEHNLHGIDIDPRCAQIAGLSLWLRAQKAWQRLGLKPEERPAIKRSNIVCAEPMPGEKELLREFVEREFPAAERGVFRRLLEAIFDQMRLAGEAGSLLKIDEEILSVIAEAKQVWNEEPQLQQSKLFAELATATQAELRFDLNGVTDDQFWDSMESRIYEALRGYAEQAENGGGFQRRLFAEDAARGFAFIDCCRKHYDVALMNPPFGEPAAIAKTYIEKGAGASKADIYTAFLSRWSSKLIDGGRLGAITPRSFIYQVDFHDFRKGYLLKQVGMPLLVELGFGELDGATNRTAAYLLVPSSSQSDVTLYANLSDDGSKAERLLALLSDLSDPDLRFARLVDFDTEASSQLLFRLSASFRTLLSTLPKLDPVLGKAHKGARNGVCNIVNGLQCPSDFRHVRLTVEVPTGDLGSRWQLFLKPLEFAPYISELACAVNWHNSGAEQKAEYECAGISPSKYISGETFYPSNGVWFPDVSERGIGASLIPFMALPGRKGLLAVGKSEQDVPSDALAGFLNSIVAEGVLGLITPERHHKPSYVGQIPWLSDEIVVRASAAHYWTMCSLAAVEASSELGDSFLAPTISLRSRSGLHETIRMIVAGCEQAVHEMEKEQTSFDELILRRLEASSTDIALLGEMSNRANVSDWFPTTFSLSENTEYDLVADLVSYWVGAAYGRWNLLAGCSETSKAQRIAQQHSLQRCPPGQLQNPQGLPARPEDVPVAYPVRIPWDGILVDELNHPLDIERRVREVIEIIWSGKEGGGAAAAIEHEACEILGVKSLRDYFRKPAGFFADHLKRYSKSRRQAPIYWPLSTASGSYTIWIYYHRLTPDTLYKCVQQFVIPKMSDVERELAHLRTVLAANEGGSKERKRLEELEDLRRELMELRTELELWAPKWKPNLNDGVLITAAPLWKLFRLPKWQKDLKACWQELEKGDYDWAHLAFTLWPDRVREKCKSDRSLAIAHGVEDLCEVQALVKKARKPKKASANGARLELGD